MLDRESRVQGYATYFEFARANYTIQIVIIPDAYSSTGHLAPAFAYWRQVDSGKPKRQWKQHRLVGLSPEVVNGSVPLDEAKITEIANARALSLNFLFDPIQKRGFELVNKPLVVQISSKDIDDVNARKTPNKVIHRVQQSRIASGFPADLVRSI